MSDQDRMYFVNRATEEESRALAAANPKAADAHRKLQRAYLERALVGDRPEDVHDPIG